MFHFSIRNVLWLTVLVALVSCNKAKKVEHLEKLVKHRADEIQQAVKQTDPQQSRESIEGQP